MDLAWQDMALCDGMGSDWFYPDEDDYRGERRAKALCSGCPVQPQCRDHGLRNEKFGIWGGLSPADRDRERRRLARHGMTLDRTLSRVRVRGVSLLSILGGS